MTKKRRGLNSSLLLWNNRIGNTLQKIEKRILYVRIIPKFSRKKVANSKLSIEINVEK